MTELHIDQLIEAGDEVALAVMEAIGADDLVGPNHVREDIEEVIENWRRIVDAILEEQA